MIDAMTMTPPAICRLSIISLRKIYDINPAVIGNSRKNYSRYVKTGQRIDIKALAEKVSEKYNVSIGELRSKGRREAVVKARHAMSWIGVRELGYSGAEVARYLGVTNSCVTRLISSGKEPDIDDINLEF